jgi:hypothetical protein
MPRDGARTFADLIGRLDHLEIVCPKCERFGPVSVGETVGLGCQN